MCTAEGEDIDRMGFLVSHLNLDDTQAQEWKLEVGTTGSIAIPEMQ